MDKVATLRDRIDGDEVGAWSGINPAQCMDCINANGEPPWADGPRKSYCLVFAREDGMRKPPAVYYEGRPCEFHRGA